MTTSKTPTHKKVVESARKAATSKKSTSPPDYVKSLARIQDRSLASELLLEQAGLEFDQGHASLRISCKGRKVKHNDKSTILMRSRHFISKNVTGLLPFSKVMNLGVFLSSLSRFSFTFLDC